MIQRLYKGILLAVLIGLLSFFIAPQIRYVNAVLLSFLVGVLIGNIGKLPADLSAGINFSGSKILEFAIVLLAFGISFSEIAAIGSSKFVLIVVMVFALIVITIFLAKRTQGDIPSNWLVGFGTAICGSSAIAALAPTVTKYSEKTGVAIAIVNLIGSVGMILIPIALGYLNVSEVNSSVLIGASLHSVGNVAGAGYFMTETIGESALTIKMARVALLSPGIIFFNILAQASGEKKSMWSYFKLPSYLWAFIAITVLVSVVPLPKSFLDIMTSGGDILLIIAMAAIGLKISLRQLLATGQKAIVFGMLIFVIQLVLISTLLLFF